jgi:hypothetical protein
LDGNLDLGSGLAHLESAFLGLEDPIFMSPRVIASSIWYGSSPAASTLMN